MGGKGSSGTAPPPVSSSNNDAALMALMLSSMNQATPVITAAPTVPEPVKTPLPERTPEVDWSDKHKQLAARMRAEYTIGRSKKFGMRQTVVTSPLLDDYDDAETTGSLLTVGPNHPAVA